jgi:hypothetical protein
MDGDMERWSRIDGDMERWKDGEERRRDGEAYGRRDGRRREGERERERESERKEGEREGQWDGPPGLEAKIAALPIFLNS